jgi:hypothetical protein
LRDFENLSLTKGVAKKIATESRFPAPEKSDVII